MASTSLLITDIAIDRSNDIWATGRDVVKYNGSNFELYNFENSAVPSNLPYYLDTRCISMDPYGDKWIGCATAPYVSDIGIFNLKGEDAQEGESWTYAEIGPTGDTLETSIIYASPYGNEVIAFITELNGGAGVTGATGPLGVTGGSLYRYEKKTEKWSEILTDFNWTHTYDIKAKGIDGENYEYWVATEIGIIIFAGGSDCVSEMLLDDGDTVNSARIINAENSSLPSSIVYSLDFDEDDNLWMGTANGLVFLSIDGEYTVWNDGELSLPSYEITVVKAVNNGQVFFSPGDGYAGQGNGLYYFNGDVLKSFTDVNSDLPNNNVTEIVTFWKKSKNTETTYYPDEVLVTCLNDFVLINYVTPHVYASAKAVGATGWNFIYYSASDKLKLPRVDKYSWEYPAWRTYQDLYLEFDHPGLDRRNLFLSTELRDIADGSAGTREYWNNGIIPNYEEIKAANDIPSNNWIAGITGDTSISDTSGISTTIMGDLYIISLSIKAATSINLGKKADGSDVIISNPNATDGTPVPSNLGIIAYYNKFGQVEGYNTIRGNSTLIYDLKPSFDQTSLYVLGGYKNNVEAGEFVYGDYPGGASGGGPIGSAVGISNINSPNIQGATGDYPWILSGYTGGTGSPYFPSWYDTGATGQMGLFLMEIGPNIGTETSHGGIDLSDPYNIRKKYFVNDFRHFPTNIQDIDGITHATITTCKRAISISANIEGGNSLLYTYAGEYPDRDDGLSLPSYIGENKGTLDGMGIHLILDLSLNLTAAQYTYSGQGPGTSTKFINLSKESSNGTSLISGTANGTSFMFDGNEIGAGITSGDYAYYILLNADGSYIDTATSSNLIGRDAIASASGNGKHYIFQGITGPTASVFAEESGLIESEYGSVVLTIDPAGVREVIGSYEIEFDGTSTLFSIDGTSISKLHTHSAYYGLTGGNNYRLLLKTGVEGGRADYLDFGSTGFGIDYMSYQTSQEGDIFFAGTNTDGTISVASDLPVPASYEIFVGLSIAARLKTGKSMGHILSKAGTNPWRWADVHRDDKNMEIPLMSTVFFSNYDSNIFGKENYKWVLTNQKTGEVILDLKNTPYFIFTFPEAGYYTLYNSIEDSKGNVYEVSKPAYINVVDHKEVRVEDNQPGLVNSYDYGYPESSTTRDDDFFRLGKEITKESEDIEKEARPQFGSGVVIKDNPDATFNEEDED